MNPEESVEVLGRLLEEANFDPERPHPLALWSAFKTWVRQPVDCDRDEAIATLLGDEAMAVMELCRSFRHQRDDLTFDVFLRLYSEGTGSPQMPMIGASSLRSRSLEEFFHRFETSDQFALALAHEGWRFEAHR